MARWSGFLACLVALTLSWAAPAAAQLERIAEREAAAGLRAALEKGSVAAVSLLGREDGFFGNPQVRIPLPDSLERAERAMRRFGMGRYADQLVLSMNRAAEAAVPEARQLFVDAVRKMTVQDAKAILTGGDTAGTEYFRRTTQDRLRERFAERGAALGLVKEEHANLDDYVTRKALDGLYATVAEEEKKIRKDPVGAGKAIIRKVFGALL
jgi:hypothetical protein